jgi:hypothetical protein
MIFLQVPPPSPTRARRLPTLPSPSGRRVPPPSWPPMRPDAGTFAFTRCDNWPRKIPYYHLNQYTLFIKR